MVVAAFFTPHWHWLALILLRPLLTPIIYAALAPLKSALFRITPAGAARRVLFADLEGAWHIAGCFTGFAIIVAMIVALTR